MANGKRDIPVDRLRAEVEAAAWEMLRREPGRSTDELIGQAVTHMLGTSADPLELGKAYESLLMLGTEVKNGVLELKPERGHARKQRGAYYTPAWLVNLVLDSALEPLIRGAGEEAVLALRVLDPACGSGVFLVASAERLGRHLAQVREGGPPSDTALNAAMLDVCGRCIFGMDADPVAVELCRAALSRRCGVASGMGARVIRGDGLLDEVPGVGGFDVVVGNPPFLNRLERTTAVNADTSRRLKDRYGAAARAYTDVSALFLLRAVLLARAGGRVAMVQPQSLLGSRDAAGVRETVLRHATMTHLWLAEERVFDASVTVCVPTFQVGVCAAGRIRRTLGRERRVTPDVEVVSSGSWSSLAAVDVPDIEVRSAGTIEDAAEVSADFRDEYYGLRGMVVERRAPEDDARFPALVTTGLIGLGECRWGLDTCRFGGRVWKHPRVDLVRLESETTLLPWARSRLRPKLLLATQTRVLEVAADVLGKWLPVTPLISVVPRRKGDLWALGAVLASPVLSAMAARLSAGTGLSRGAIKLSASQVRKLPMPEGTLREAALIFRRATAAGDAQRGVLLLEAGRSTCRAFGVSGARTRELMAWWVDRMGTGPRFG